MSKISKKGKNPGVVDNWLDNLGLYRKNVAYDETCLFRAISEQLFDCQVHHERVRRDCIAFARQNYKEFCKYFQSQDDYFEHLYKLEKHMVICGDLELKIVGKKYNRNITIFDAADQQIYHLMDKNIEEAFLLCLMDKDHYDVVYKKEHIVTAGFCQSIVYKMLYEEVFNISGVDEIVHNMLYDKGNIITQAELLIEKKRILLESEGKDLTTEELEEKLDDKKLAVNIAPFPFKIAKALDPNIYRNIEYDSWGEMRREWRLGEWYYGDNKLILGTKCIYNEENTNEKYDCYIQQIIKNENKCVVYLTKLAEKRTVNYADLSPEDNAKPWPLPYRFSKSVVISPTTPPVDKTAPKPKKRVKDKKRTKSESSVLSLNVTKPEALVDNVDAYVGIPLQMHSPNHNENSSFCHSENSTETQTEAVGSQETTSNTIETGSSDNSRWYQTSYQWPQYVPQNSDPFLWPTSTAPQNMFNFNMKPMVASAPVTPNVIPYHDLSYPYYYNYHVESYQNYSQWSSPPFELQPPPPPRNNQKLQEQDHVEPHIQNTSEQELSQPHKVEIDHCDSQSSSGNTSESSGNYTTQSETPGYSQHCAPCTQIEMYSPISPVVHVPQLPTGASILYATGPPEMTEVIMPTTPVLYTPPVEMSYMQPGPYIYPPTPPASWYPTGITTQGFIFPPRH